MKKLFPGTLWATAMVLFLLVSGRAADKTRIEGLVVPDNVSSQQPFSFSVPQSSGSAVDIQTVSGEVVQQATTDKYGRIFLAGGLPAGAYLISMGPHHQPIGKLDIKPTATENLQHVSQQLQIQNPGAVKFSDPFSLSGHGFNPNCGSMQVSLAGSGKTEAPLVLAATKDQLKLAPIQQLQPGMAQLRVTNQATGQSSEPQPVLLYSIRGELGRNTIKSGHDETQLTLKVQPENMALKVKVNVVSGPVDFGQGSKEVEGVTSNGQAVFPVHAQHGAGEFQLAWELAELPPVLAQARDGGGIADASLATASEADFPDPQRYSKSARFDPYETLLNNKKDWLERRILALKDAITEENKQLNAPGGNKGVVQGEIQANTKAMKELKDELGVLNGKDIDAQKEKVRKNVANWLANLRVRIAELQKEKDEEKKLAGDANNSKDRERHETNEKAAADELNRDLGLEADLQSAFDKAFPKK